VPNYEGCAGDAGIEESGVWSQKLTKEFVVPEVEKVPGISKEVAELYKLIAKSAEDSISVVEKLQNELRRHQKF